MHGYLEDFLFPPDRARTPVRALSGGERNRLLLARLFTRTFNLLVLDEPTNDLDIETLDLLEELLLDFAGTLIVVSHDRAFLDNVVTSTLVFEGAGRVGEYVGGYTDWVRQRKQAASAAPSASKRLGCAIADSRESQKAQADVPREGTELASLPRANRLARAGSANSSTRRWPIRHCCAMAPPWSRSRARLESLDAELREQYDRPVGRTGDHRRRSVMIAADQSR